MISERQSGGPGSLGKVDNCQAAVFGVLTGGQRHMLQDRKPEGKDTLVVWN
jgi:hypothetical protein